jgi:hypothetical protein
VCIHATREGTRASDLIHLTGQCRQKQKAGHSGLFTTLAYLHDWKLAAIFKNTACKTPQQNSYAELAFTVIAATTRAVMNAA